MGFKFTERWTRVAETIWVKTLFETAVLAIKIDKDWNEIQTSQKVFFSPRCINVDVAVFAFD